MDKRLANEFIQELRSPFSQNPITSAMAKAIFLMLGSGATVHISNASTLQNFTGIGVLILMPGQWNVGRDVWDSSRDGLKIRVMSSLHFEAFTDYRDYYVRKF